MRIPIPFKDLLPIEAVKQLSQLVVQPSLVAALKDAAQKLGLKEQLQPGNIQQILQQAGRWMESVAWNKAISSFNSESKEFSQPSILEVS